MTRRMAVRFGKRGAAWRRILREKRGNMAVEFVLVAPILVILLGGIIEIGLAIHTRYTLQDGLLVGANYASHKEWNATAIQDAVKASSPRLNSATITLSRFCGCPSGTTISTVALCDTATSPGACPAACTATCTSDGAVTRRYLTLTASLARPRVFGQSFGLPNAMTATVKTKLP